MPKNLSNIMATSAYINSRWYYSFCLLFIVTFQSGINISSQLSINVLAITLLLVYTLMLGLIYPPVVFAREPTKTSAVVLSLLVIITYTMSVRGIGFEVLGSAKSGGMFYVKLLSMLLCYLLVIRSTITVKQVHHLFIFFCAASVLPFLSDVVYITYNEETIFNRFVSGSSTIEFYVQNDTTSLLRIQSATALAESMFLMSLVYLRIFNNDGKITVNIVNLILILTILFLIIISGHRITLVGITLTFILYYSFRFGTKKIIKPLCWLGSATVVMCILIIANYEILPANLQRIFSFLPFIPTNEVTLEAADSLNFRVFMAAKALTMLPDYYIIGKGFAFNNYQVNFDDYFGIIDIFSEIGVFHNGLLGLLINLGLPGLIIGLLLLTNILRNVSSKNVRQSDRDIQNILLVVRCKILVTVFYFCILYGDVQTNFIDLLAWSILYKIINFNKQPMANLG